MLTRNTDRSEERNDLLREKLQEYFDKQYITCQLCPFETLDNRFFDEHCLRDESYQPLPKKKKNTPQKKRKKTKANGRSISKKDTLPRRIEKENNQDLSRDASPQSEDNEPPTDLNTQKHDLNNNVGGENDKKKQLHKLSECQDRDKTNTVKRRKCTLCQ